MEGSSILLHTSPAPNQGIPYPSPRQRVRENSGLPSVMLMAKEISPIVKTNARRASSLALPLVGTAPASVAKVLQGSRFLRGVLGDDRRCGGALLPRHSPSAWGTHPTAASFPLFTPWPRVQLGLAWQKSHFGENVSDSLALGGAPWVALGLRPPSAGFPQELIAPQSLPH